MRYYGLGVSPGIAAGSTLWLSRNAHPQTGLSGPAAKEALALAKDRATKELQSLLSTMSPGPLRDIMEAHELILEDPELWELIDRHIDQGLTSDEAVDKALSHFHELLANSGNEYVGARSDDVYDVGQRIRRGISAMPQVKWPASEPKILVADSLYPSDAAAIDLKYVKGIVLGTGSETSHVAILARSLGIPAVILGEQVNTLNNHTPLVMDGKEGLVSTDAADQKNLRNPQKPVAVIRGHVATADGVRVHVMANIGSLFEAQVALENGADGIGLLRTEFFFEDHLPSEEEHYARLHDIAKLFGPGQPIVVRVADIGGDKPLPYLRLPAEANPFLGKRAIRLFPEYSEIYEPQLRAIVRLAQTFDIRVMFPMIATEEDWAIAKKLLAKSVADVQESTSSRRSPLAGMMIEIPSAALISETLADQAQFFSIGTNDLIQYVFAADRTQAGLSRYYQPDHPAVLRLIKMTIDAANRAGIPVALCGEMAGNLDYLPILLNLGLREFSMAPSNIPPFKQAVSNLRMG